MGLSFSRGHISRIRNNVIKPPDVILQSRKQQVQSAIGEWGYNLNKREKEKLILMDHPTELGFVAFEKD